MLFLLFLSGCSLYPKDRQIPGGGTASGKAISKTALSTIGTRYKYGGTAPSTGFDCSGLLYWSYDKHGIPLPRTTSQQTTVGKPVKKNNLQPGDIVVFKINSKQLHTGIYTGNGKFVHSPSTGKKVREEPINSKYWSPKFIAGRRHQNLR